MRPTVGAKRNEDCPNKFGLSRSICVFCFFNLAVGRLMSLLYKAGNHASRECSKGQTRAAEVQIMRA
jgi:hypothetical protein